MMSARTLKITLSKWLGLILLAALFMGLVFTKPVFAQEMRTDTGIPSESANNGVLILCFHEISTVSKNTPWSAKALYLPPSVFDQIIKYLKDNGYTFMKLSEVYKAWAANEDIPTKTAVITFDDGYSSVYTYALPILKKYNVPFTDFIITDDLNVPGYLTDEQVKAMADTGLAEIGGHTSDHYNLKYLTAQEQEKQIGGCVQYIEKLLPGYKVTSFAVPYGEYNDDTKLILRKYGITMDVTTQYGIAQRTNDWLLLPRVYINALPLYTYYKMGSNPILSRLEDIVEGKLIGEPDGPPVCALQEGKPVTCDQVIAFSGGEPPYHVHIKASPGFSLRSSDEITTENTVLVPFRPTMDMVKRFGTRYNFSFVVTDSDRSAIFGRKSVQVVEPLAVHFAGIDPGKTVTVSYTATFAVDIRTQNATETPFDDKPTGYAPLKVQWFLDNSQIVLPKEIASIDDERINFAKAGTHTITVRVKDNIGEVATASITVHVQNVLPHWINRHMLIAE